MSDLSEAIDRLVAFVEEHDSNWLTAEELREVGDLDATVASLCLARQMRLPCPSLPGNWTLHKCLSLQAQEGQIYDFSEFGQLGKTRIPAIVASLRTPEKRMVFSVFEWRQELEVLKRLASGDDGSADEQSERRGKPQLNDEEALTEPMTLTEVASYFGKHRNQANKILKQYPHTYVGKTVRMRISDMPPEYLADKGLPPR